jgi:hypothetical protein
MTVEIVALDPGVTTGVATYQFVNGKDIFRSFHIEPRIYPHPHETLYDMLCALGEKTLIYEAFHFRQGMDGAVFTGVEYIGVIELVGQLNCLEVVKITPSDGKGFWDDKKLRAIGAHKPGHIHANDAMRVLLRHKMKDQLWMEKILPILKEKL